MKSFTAEFVSLLRNRANQRNVMLLIRFLMVLALLVALWSFLFHVLMEREGKQYSWITGFYWTLTVMSTLGFGDITFHSDIGRLFSICVLLSGTVFMLVLLPFTFIEFFYEPWVQAQAAARTPRELLKTITNHVILTHYDSVTEVLINKLTQYHYEYVLIVPDLQEALRLHDIGLCVIHGDLDNPDTYRRINVQYSALLATTATDAVNTNVAFTVRGVSSDIPIIATAKDAASVDILQLAGCNRVLQLGELMGGALARRTGCNAMTHVVGQFDQLCIAEATAAETPLVGKTLKESNLRQITECTVLGIWKRGTFNSASPDTPITADTVLVLAGSRSQLQKYDEFFSIYHMAGAPVVIIGGGRVGRAVGRELAAREIDYRIVEKQTARIHDKGNYVYGDAAELEVLQAAGIMKAPAVVITSRDDDTNIYLAIYCRKLRPDIQIIARTTHERNVPTLHRAGTDFVMSYASMGASTILNLLQDTDIMMIAEGLNVFRVKMPHELEGKTIAESQIRERTGCSVVAINVDSEMQINPAPNQSLPVGGEITLIGASDAEQKFLDAFA